MQEQEEKVNILALILLIILIGINSIAILFIIGVSRVDAASPDYWYDNFKAPMYVEYWGWTSSTAHNTLSTKKDSWYVQGNSLDQRSYVVNTNAMNLDTLGLSFRVTTQETMKSNYIYSWQIAVCSDKSMDDISFVSVSNQSDRSSNYSYGTKINMSNVPSYTNWTSCKVFSGLVEDTEGSNNLYIKIKPSSTISNEYLYLLGYNLQPQGLYEQWISQTIASAIASQNTTIQGYINQQTTNLTTIMNNNTQSTNTTIEETTQQQIESQQVCTNINASNITTLNKGLDSYGAEFEYSGYGITDYIDVSKAELKQTETQSGSNSFMCFYTANKAVIQCISTLNHGNGTYTKPSGTTYARFTINRNQNVPVFNLCKNGNQAQYDQNNEDNWQQEDPDSDPQETLEDEESMLDNYLADDSDLSALTIDVNTSDSIVIWDIFNRIITGNTILYSTFITILVFGIVKTVFAR